MWTVWQEMICILGLNVLKWGNFDRGERPGLLLNIQQYIEQTLNKGFPGHMSTGLRLRNPALDEAPPTTAQCLAPPVSQPQRSSDAMASPMLRAVI